jgi:hypothetical protein
VRRGVGMNVGERVAPIVLINGGRRNASVNDLAKQAAHDANSAQERSLS